MKKFTAFIASLLLAACQHNIEQPIEAEPVSPTPPSYSGATVIGGVETLYIIPMEMPFQARIDTGAETSSMDADHIEPFERDGEKWVSFNITNRKNGEKHHFEKPIKRRTSIVRIGTHEERYVVNMSIKIGDEIIKSDFTLAQRDKFSYQVLIGRNILNGRFIIDPALENTMH